MGPDKIAARSALVKYATICPPLQRSRRRLAPHVRAPHRSKNMFEIPNKQYMYPEPSELHMAPDATTSQLLGMTGGARTPKRWTWQRKAL